MDKGYKQIKIGSISFLTPLEEQIAYMLTLKKYVVDCVPVHKIAFKTKFKPGVTFHKYRKNEAIPYTWSIIIRKQID